MGKLPSGFKTKEEYAKYMRDYRERQSYQKFKHDLQKRYEEYWREMVKKEFSSVNFENEFSGDLVKDTKMLAQRNDFFIQFGFIAWLSLRMRNETEDIDNMDELDKKYKAETEYIKKFLKGCKEL
jgi:hypothetical protein